MKAASRADSRSAGPSGRIELLGRQSSRRRHHSGRRSLPSMLVFALLAGLLAAGLSTVTATPAQAAPGDPFNSAAATVFVAQRIPTRLYAATTDGTGTTTFTAVGAASNFQYNAIAYRTADNYIYGMSISAGTTTNGAAIPAGSMIRIGQDGYITRGGTLRYTSDGGVGHGFTVGGFGADGSWYTMYGTTGTLIRVVNPTTGALVRTITLTPPEIADFVFKDGYFWGIRHTTGQVVRINPTNGAVAVLHHRARHRDRYRGHRGDSRPRRLQAVDRGEEDEGRRPHPVRPARGGLIATNA